MRDPVRVRLLGDLLQGGRLSIAEQDEVHVLVEVGQSGDGLLDAASGGDAYAVGDHAVLRGQTRALAEHPGGAVGDTVRTEDGAYERRWCRQDVGRNYPNCDGRRY